MKKIDFSHITSAVGQPFKSGTWKHLQEAYTDIFAGLLQMQNRGTAFTANTVYVLYGCVMTGSVIVGQPFASTAGAVLYNGEIYFVPAFTTASVVTGVVATLVISPTTSAAADPVTMTDLSTPNVHLNRTIVIVDGSGATSGYLVNYSAFSFLQSDWNSVGGTGQPAFQNGFSNVGAGTNSLAFKKNIDNTVSLRGALTTAANPIISATIFTLPAAYRPLAASGQGILYENTGSSTHILTTVIIRANGNVDLFVDTGSSTALGAGGSLDLGNIRFHLD